MKYLKFNHNELLKIPYQIAIFILLKSRFYYDGPKNFNGNENQLLIEYLNERKYFQKRIQDLEEENRNLEEKNRELMYQPGGPGAIEAKEHFDDLLLQTKK